jgi:microcystin-dependent protein
MSSYTKIVNYAAKDALVEGDPNKIIKGTELDAEFVAIQTAIGTKADLNSPVFTGIPRAPTAAVGTNTTQVATTAFVMANAIPVGGIIMWSGIVATIPNGWALCNGSNGTPDLRDKFVIGAGSTYAPAATGGSATVTLLEANLPAHTHAFTGTAATGGSHNHTVSDPGHTHTVNERTGAGGADGGFADSWKGRTSTASSTQTTGISLAAHAGHTHDVTGTCATTGSGTAVNILPPYFALAYIMRTA